MTLRARSTDPRAAYDTDEPRARAARMAPRALLEDRARRPSARAPPTRATVGARHGRARFARRNPAAVRTLATSATELEEADAFYAECGAP